MINHMGRPPKKYHWSSGGRKYDDFQFTESDWEDIESNSDYEFDLETRDFIRDATQHFLMMADMESQAPRMYPRGSRTNKKLNAAERRIMRIRNSTRALVNILRQNPTDRNKREAESEADHLIMMNCEALPELGGPRVAGTAADRRNATLSLADRLSLFLNACERAYGELKLHKNAQLFKDGDAWNSWVAAIGKCLAKRGHRTSASLIHSQDENIPPFVRLIEALQTHLPPKFIRRGSSDEALAKAVQKAMQHQSQDS